MAILHSNALNKMSSMIIMVMIAMMSHGMDNGGKGGAADEGFPQKVVDGREEKAAAVRAPKIEHLTVSHVVPNVMMIKMAPRGPRDASSTNCPEFGDQLNGRTCYVPR